MTDLNTSPNQGKPPPKKQTFVEQVEAVFRRHGYRDWAVVVRQDGKKPERWLGAGYGTDAFQDREAVGMLMFELQMLQDSATALANRLEREGLRRLENRLPGDLPPAI